MPAFPSQLCYLCSQTNRTQLPTLGVFSFCQCSSKSLVISGFWLDLRWPCLYQVKWLFRASAALTWMGHSPTAVSFSIYFQRFPLHGGTGLLLSCWLLWKAMCCKYSILMCLVGTVSQFRIWLWERDSKTEFPFPYVCSGLGLHCTEIQMPRVGAF